MVEVLAHGKEEAPYTITGHALVNELIADADGLTREEKFSIQENHNPNNGTATIDPKSEVGRIRQTKPLEMIILDNNH